MTYIEYFIETLKKVDFKDWELIKEMVLECTGRIFVIGNGGSLLNAGHIASDLVKVRHKNAIALNNIAIMSAYANDYGYEKTFIEQLRKTKIKHYDILLAISAGLSRNIMDAAYYCKKECKVILITKGLPPPQQPVDILNYADYVLAYPTDSTETFENLTSVFGHYLVS